LVLANENNKARKPNHLSHVEAASLSLVGVSAWQALVENIGLSKDQKILIHGGAEGIGSIFPVDYIKKATQKERIWYNRL
jgi:alcohol dehydrogenase